MPLAVLVSILMGIVPGLVQVAEKKFTDSGSGPQKRQWVIDGVHSALQGLVAHEPSWLRPANDLLEPLVDDIIDFALDKAGLAA